MRSFPLQSYFESMLEIACSGNDYRGAYYGNRRFAGVFRFAIILYDFSGKRRWPFLCYNFLGITSITTKYFNGIKESVREGIAPNGDGENRTGFLFSKEFL